MMSQHVCRCCLQENPQITYKIFETSSTLLKDLQDCSPSLVKYEQNDGLSQIICDRCWLRVQEAKEFRNKCWLADQELRNRYAEYKNEAVEEVLGILEKFRQEDNESCNLKTNGLTENILENLDDKDVPDFDALEMSFITDYMAFDQDFNNSSHDSGIFEEELCGQKTNNFENILQTDTNPESLPVVQSPAKEECKKVLKTDQKKSSKGPFPCSHCDKKFTRNFQLKLHLISIHNIGSGPQYNCELCSKKFASLHSLNYHQKSVHYQQKSHACSHCDRQFITKSQLVSHMRIHTGEAKPRIFECPECDKKWPTKSDLRTHMRTHDPNVERPFKCDQCEKSFFTRGHLNSHMLVHTGEKPYVCEFCNRSYQCVGNLNNHLARRHNKEVMGREDDNKGVLYSKVQDEFAGGEVVLMEL